MNKDDIIKELHSGNLHLDNLTKYYFITHAKLFKPRIGDSHFKYLVHKFKYAIREYAITYSYKIKPQEEPSLRKLLKIHSIEVSILREYIIKVNAILQSYTDKNITKEKKRVSLKYQIEKFINNDSNNVNIRILEKLNDDDLLNMTQNKYLDAIINIMEEEGLNQINSKGHYLVIDKLLDLYSRIIKVFEFRNFKEKKKYLIKLDNTEKASKKLYQDIKEMLDSYDNDNDCLETIRWYFFYLIYDKHKIDIFLIHSILGFKFNGATKLFKKLFLKDHSTGKNNNFLHHTHIEDIDKDSLHEDNFIYEQIIRRIKKEIF